MGLYFALLGCFGDQGTNITCKKQPCCYNIPYNINQKWPQHHVVATTPCPSNFANAFFNALMLPTPDILPTKQQDAAALLFADWVTLASPLATPPQASTAVASPTAINPLSPLTVDSCAAAALAAM